jgi:hypothetical protein
MAKINGKKTSYKSFLLMDRLIRGDQLVTNNLTFLEWMSILKKLDFNDFYEFWAFRGSKYQVFMTCDPQKLAKYLDLLNHCSYPRVKEKIISVTAGVFSRAVRGGMTRWNF